MQSVILEARQLSKVFGNGRAKVRAVDNIDFTLSAGEIVLVMGPSGSGKTTFLSMLGGLLSPSDGQVKLGQRSLQGLSERELSKVRAVDIGFIFQSFNLLEALSVEENILLPAKLSAQSSEHAKQRANQLIEKLGLSQRKKALPKTLSGGEKQRVAIARALINEPKLILADEPTGNLDSQTGQEVMMILHDIVRDTGVAVLVVTHDPRLEAMADRILWLEDGKIRDRKNEEHAWVTDPVCRMKVDQWRATIVAYHQDKPFYFCSENCKARFEKDPTAFIEA